MDSYLLTSEKTIQINTFWQGITEHTFITDDNIEIAYMTNFKRPKKPFIIIVPGRTEAYLKYQELAYDLDNKGFDCAIIDHRGQGLSQRLTQNPYKGYVDDFNHYISDLHQLLATELPIKYPEHSRQCFLLAHSMGGAISARYLQTQPHQVIAAALSAPMFGINSGAIPNALVSSLCKFNVKINAFFSSQPWYFFGQNNTQVTDFSKNKLMHCNTRFQRFQHIYNQQPKIKLGGVTHHWLAESLQAIKEIFNDINKISVPVLLLQAGNDVIVDNKGQNDFYHNLHQQSQHSDKKKHLITIPGAYHELFFELDQYRDLSINHVVGWFTEYANS